MYLPIPYCNSLPDRGVHHFRRRQLGAYPVHHWRWPHAGGPDLRDRGLAGGHQQVRSRPIRTVLPHHRRWQDLEPRAGVFYLFLMSLNIWSLNSITTLTASTPTVPDQLLRDRPGLRWDHRLRGLLLQQRLLLFRRPVHLSIWCMCVWQRTVRYFGVWTVNLPPFAYIREYWLVGVFLCDEWKVFESYTA